MLIRVPGRHEPNEREVTPEKLYFSRRELLVAGAAGAVALAGASGAADTARAAEPAGTGADWKPATPRSPYSTDDEVTRYRDATRYNNFYEFGTNKRDPAANAGTLRPSPWSVEVAGAVKKPGRRALEDLLSGLVPEERIYRMRCVEAWSMVIPWLGIPLRDLLNKLEPTPAAKFVAFETLFDPEQMPGQKPSFFGGAGLKWPYREGLRIDEAMHPLALMGTGMYGRELPNQSGAPLRLVVPWKYGFKSIKSIVKIELTETMPPTTWNTTAPDEYGFYANVNPKVDHPRWSQATERRVGHFGRQPTLPFNGYAEQVASLYAGMNLRKNF